MRAGPLRPRRRQNDRDLESLRRVAQKACNAVRVEANVARLFTVELEAVLLQDRAKLVERALDVRVRIGVAQEVERVGARIPEECGRESDRRVVGRVEPELERHAVLALVEMQSQTPRRTDEPCEALVDPARDALLERSVADAVRQLRLGRGQPVEQRLDAAVPAERPCRAERHVGCDEPVARDAVDEPWVHVVHDGDTIAVEVVGDHRRCRDRGRGERLLDLRLERRAPECEPLAADLDRLREHEPFGDGAPRELTHVEQRTRGVGELFARLEDGELVDRQEPAAVHLAAHVKLVVARERTVAREREGDGVGVPDQLEHGQAS